VWISRQTTKLWTLKMASQTMRMRETSSDITHKPNIIPTAPNIVLTQGHDSQGSFVFIGILHAWNQWVSKLRNVFSFTTKHDTKAHMGPQVSFTPSETWRLDWGEWSTQRPDFCAREKCFCTHFRGAGWAPQPVWKGIREEKILAHTGVLTPDHSGAASCHTDYDIRV